MAIKRPEFSIRENENIFYVRCRRCPYKTSVSEGENLKSKMKRHECENDSLSDNLLTDDLELMIKEGELNNQELFTLLQDYERHARHIQGQINARKKSGKNVSLRWLDNTKQALDHKVKSIQMIRDELDNRLFDKDESRIIKEFVDISRRELLPEDFIEMWEDAEKKAKENKAREERSRIPTRI